MINHKGNAVLLRVPQSKLGRGYAAPASDAHAKPRVRSSVGEQKLKKEILQLALKISGLIRAKGLGLGFGFLPLRAGELSRRTESRPNPRRFVGAAAWAAVLVSHDGAGCILRGSDMTKSPKLQVPCFSPMGHIRGVLKPSTPEKAVKTLNSKPTGAGPLWPLPSHRPALEVYSAASFFRSWVDVGL